MKKILKRILSILPLDALFKDIKQLQDVVFSQQEKRSNELSEWREFDLEAATGREFETR